MAIKILVSLFLVIFLKSTWAGPVAPDCPTLMYSKNWAALPPSFPGVVAHGVHSITIPDIRYYFPNNKTDRFD